MQDFKILSEATKFFFTGEQSFLKAFCTYFNKVLLQTQQLLSCIPEYLLDWAQK